MTQKQIDLHELQAMINVLQQARAAIAVENPGASELKTIDKALSVGGDVAQNGGSMTADEGRVIQAGFLAITMMPMVNPDCPASVRGLSGAAQSNGFRLDQIIEA